MEPNTQDYRMSFFKPTNKRTKANRNMVLWLVLIWAIAIFGFQIALRVLEKPTPEPILNSYNSLKENVYQGTATTEQYQEFTLVPLQVLCKVFISPDERAQLQTLLNWSFFKTLDTEQSLELEKEIKSFEKTEEVTTDILDADYQKAKANLITLAAPILGLSETDIRAKILPLELSSEYQKNISQEQTAQIETILNKYLIHNESVLTRTKILGFPFHYFYTAVFLLILFVLLCLLYCISADRLNKKYQIED
jgi:putative solute:sodium symporter small subunit